MAANAVQGVVAPETCGIGGDLFALVHVPGTPAPACLNASGRAGSGASARALRDRGHTTMPLYGPAPVTVPGCVDGWYALAGRFGSLPLSDVLAPALRLAREGFPASSELSATWARHAHRLRTQPSAAPMFPGGRPPLVGQRITRPYLAETLGAVISGRDSFYLERVGAAITEATGNAITSEDLARPQADWVEPLSRNLFGLTAWTTPPNSQGYLTLATLSIFEMLEVTTDPVRPAYWHGLIEAYRSVAWERNHLLADPSRGAPGSELLDPDLLQRRAAAIRPHRVGRWERPVPAAGGTAYMCAVDGNGMGVSLIQSNFHGIGSGLSAGRTGVWLHNRGAGFSLTPGHRNELAPGRRPLHTLSPTIWTRGDQLALAGYQRRAPATATAGPGSRQPLPRRPRPGRCPSPSPLDHRRHRHCRVGAGRGRSRRHILRRLPQRSWPRCDDRRSMDGGLGTGVCHPDRSPRAPRGGGRSPGGHGTGP